MKILKWCILSAAVAAALTVGELIYRQKRQDGEIWYLRRENTRLRGEAYRRATAAQSASVPAKVSAAGVAESASSAGGGAARVVEEYRNAGRATARAALQTLAWACDRGDVAALVELTQLEPQARTKAETYYASLPADARRQWKSADEMVATFMTLAAQMSPFPSADVLAAAAMEPAGDDRMALRVPGTNKDGLAFRRGANGEWSFALDAATMERLFAVAKNLAATAN
jgi:hypothetical protein